MVNITRKNIIFTTITESAATTTEKVTNKVDKDELFVDDGRKKVGCVDINAINSCSDCLGCYNNNNIPVRGNTSCCEYKKFKCSTPGPSNQLCYANGTYVGGVPDLTTAIFKDTICNSGQTCCEFFCDGEYRGDYDTESELGVCSDYNPDNIKLGQIGTNGGYDSLDAFQNAITNGIMCNCFSDTPTINLVSNYGKTHNRILFNPSEWPKKSVEDNTNDYIYVSTDIKNHPPNIFVNLKICGYPKNINVFREQSVQSEESTHILEFNTYNNYYGNTPQEITKNKSHFTLPNNVKENKNEFNEGLKIGNNIVTITCANNKQMIYKVCVPHQTVPYEDGMWKTQFFNCDVSMIAKQPNRYIVKTYEVDESNKEYVTINFSPKDIDSGFRKAVDMGFRGTKIDIISSYQKQTNDDGTINLEAIKFLSCKKCGGGFGICGKGSCVGAKCCPPMITIKIPL